MSQPSVALAFAFVSLVIAPAAVAQTQPDSTSNPLAGSARAVTQGQNIFRGRCAVCHGMDAKGYRGTDLTSGEWTHGGTDAQLFRTISRGVARPPMPGQGKQWGEEGWVVKT